MKSQNELQQSGHMEGPRRKTMICFLGAGLTLCALGPRLQFTALFRADLVGALNFVLYPKVIALLGCARKDIDIQA